MKIEEFLEREKKADLFSVYYKDIPLWELVRYDLYNSLVVTNREVPSIQKSFKELLATKFRFLAGLIISSPLFHLSKKKVLIIKSPKDFKTEQNTWIDPFTIDIENSYPKEEVETYNSYGLSNGKRSTRPNVSSVYEFTYQLSKIVSKKKNLELEEKINIICHAFPEEDFSYLIKHKVYAFQYSVAMFKFIFKHRKPEQIYLVNYIYNLPVIFVAKKNGIKVTEIQHGFTSPNTSLYHFPGIDKNSLALFPEEYQYLDKYQIYKVDYPIDESRMHLFQGKFFREKFNRLKNSPEIENAVLFISQQVLHQEIIGFITHFCQLLKEKQSDLKVYYKPHPYEYEMIDEETVKSLQENYNFFFINKDEDVYYYIASIKIVIGVFSSALLEALDYGDKVFILRMSGYEHFQYIIEDGHVNLVESPEQLFHYLSSEPVLY